jgi:hypothetical protein
MTPGERDPVVSDTTIPSVAPKTRESGNDENRHDGPSHGAIFH